MTVVIEHQILWEEDDHYFYADCACGEWADRVERGLPNGFDMLQFAAEQHVKGDQ